MKNIMKHKSYFDVLSKSNGKLRKSLMKNMSKDQRKATIELLVNISKGNLKVSPATLQKLKKHKSLLRRLCKVCYSSKRNKIINTNSKSAKKLVEQTGGFLPFAILPLLALAGKAALGGAVSAGAGYATKKIIDAASK